MSQDAHRAAKCLRIEGQLGEPRGHSLHPLFPSQVTQKI